jgi:hypothetical protein
MGTVPIAQGDTADEVEPDLREDRGWIRSLTGKLLPSGTVTNQGVLW